MRDRLIDAVLAAIGWDMLARLLHHPTLLGSLARIVRRLWRNTRLYRMTQNVCFTWKLLARDVAVGILGLMLLAAGVSALWPR